MLPELMNAGDLALGALPLSAMRAPRLDVAARPYPFGPALARRELTAVHNTGWTVFAAMNLQIVAAQVRSNGYNGPQGWTVLHLPSTPLVVISLSDHAGQGLGPCLAKRGACCILAWAHVSLAPASAGPPPDSSSPQVSRRASKSLSPRSGTPRAPADQRRAQCPAHRRSSLTRRTPGDRAGRAQRCSRTPRSRSRSQLHQAS